MRITSTFIILLATTLCFGLPNDAAAQPKPGDVFREYTWSKDITDDGSFLRVGVQQGGSAGDRRSGVDCVTAPVVLTHDFELAEAIKAEVIIEKLLCHDGTRGLAIQVNGHDWVEIPEATRIPSPPWDYQHHIYPVVPISLAHLKQGRGNEFRLRVSPEHPWKWPQNLIYGVHFRIYYDLTRKKHPTGRLVAPQPGSEVGRTVELGAMASSPNGRIRQVDFLGLYEDVNFEGEGEYRQWHYHYFRGDLTNHIGTVAKQPFRMTWDTSWVPDQPQAFQLAARITDDSGLIYFTEAVTGLKFKRPGLAVELCKPYDIPKQWVTRAGEKQEKFRVAGDLSKAVAIQLVWSSWSPGYMNGIHLNGTKVFSQEGLRYQYFAHRVTLSDVRALVPGENLLSTGLTPKYNGKMVHGMEVNWPGIMALIQYRTD